MKTNYLSATNHLMPDGNFIFSGQNPYDYEQIDWQDERPQPTKAECEAVYPQVKYETDYAEVERARQRRYIEETDGIFFDAMRGDQDLTEWKAAVAQIKTDLPYPTEPS